MKNALLAQLVGLGLGLALSACSKDAPPPAAPDLTSPAPGVTSTSTAAASAPLAPAAGTTAPTGDADPLVGKPAPDFTAKAQDGEEIHLAALKGKKVVVYFYPKDETPGCTKEACSFRDSWKAIADSGAVLVGVSTDDLESHKKFAEHWKLPFHLISDADGSIAGKFGVPNNGGYLARQTFVIGADGNVKRAYRKVDVSTHAAEITADLK